MSEIGDAPLYNTCSLPNQVMTTGPLPAPSKCKSGQFNVPREMKTKFPAMVMVFGVVIPWCNQVAGGRPWMWQLDYFVWSYVKNITNMTSHNTKASLIATIRRAPAGACRKGILPVPDPHRGGDWGWKWLHWIDVSSTT